MIAEGNRHIKRISMKIRLHLWFVFVVVLLGILPVSAYDFQVDGIYYNINGEEVTVTNETGESNSNSYSGDVVIPSSVSYEGKSYSVTSIGEYAFQNCSHVTSVMIPETVVSIGDFAFSVCTSLTKMELPALLQSIGTYSFSSCTELISVTLPMSVNRIGIGAFFRCTKLKTMEIPDLVERIEESTFSLCESLEAIKIPSSVVYIGPSAFAFCSKLTSVTIPQNVSNIGIYAFAYCDGLQEIRTFATNPPVIDPSTFDNYTLPLYVPVGCTGAYQEAENWSDFTNIVEMPSSIESISDSNMHIYVVDRTLHVENNEGAYQVYTAAGQLVYTGRDTTVSLIEAGVYIVLMEDGAQKVVVK